MIFNAAIEKIMPDVQTGSQEPFVIYRDTYGEWHCDFTQNQYGEVYDWVEAVKEQDPLALTYKGADFSKGSFPFVYDSVLCDRIRAEYDIARSSGKDDDKLHALVCFFNDNISELSFEVTDYLTTLERPLTALNEMCPINLTTDFDGWSFNLDLQDDAIDYIEIAVGERNRPETAKSNLKLGDGSDAANKVIADIIERKEWPTETRREVEGYKEINSMQLARRLVLLCENQHEAEPYMVCNCRWDNSLGINEYYNGAVTVDFLEAVREFTKRIDALAQEVEAEQGNFKYGRNVLSISDCVPDGLNSDLKGKLIIIKPEVLSPEYRAAHHQIKIVTGGFGASPSARGNAVFCEDLYSGKQSRFERYDVLGVAAPERLPEWAKERLALREALKEPGVFKYGGWHFKPVRQFKKGEVDKAP